MERQEQARICTELADGIRSAMLERIPNLPENWDGIELRWWMADLAMELYSPAKQPSNRSREYRNDRATRYGL